MRHSASMSEGHLLRCMDNINAQFLWDIGTVSGAGFYQKIGFNVLLLLAFLYHNYFSMVSK